MATTEFVVSESRRLHFSTLIQQVPYVCIALFVALHAILPTPEGIWLYVPLLASMLFLGLPHGAVDHMVLLQLQNKVCSPVALARVIFPYLVLAGCYLVMWFLTPALAFGLFILITWFHWGQGDVHTLVIFARAAHLTSVHMRRLALVVRGGLPMLIPLLAFPEVYQEVFTGITSRFTTAAATDITWPFAPSFRLGMGLGFAGLTTFYFLYGFYKLRWGLNRAYLEDLAEVILLAVLFASVHPLVAIGLYFCCWHAVRHIARIVVFSVRDDQPDTGHQVEMKHGAIKLPVIKQGIRRFFIQALPTTLVALLGLGMLHALVPHTPESVAEFTGLYLVLIAVLTVPHVWVVWRMDTAEGVWSTLPQKETVIPVPNS
ncbi:MAG: Brp/Blh family beta-carotene 15,15'-dioxygenase [Bacteroidota bacterium]